MTMKMAILPGGGKGDTGASYSRGLPNKEVSTRPRPPALWTVQECELWLRRHCGDIGVLYSELLNENNVNGMALLRINSAALERMGISNSAHREEIWREIIKLKLKSDVLELRDLENHLSIHYPTSNI